MGFFNIFRKRKEVKEIKEDIDSSNHALADINKEIAIMHSRQVKESIDIINTTNRPNTFFYRYDFLIKKLKELATVAQKIDYAGENPLDYLKELQSNKINIFNDFINRYYEDILLKIQSLKTNKAKLNNADKFYSTLHDNYDDYLEDKNKIEIDKLYQQLKESIEL